jgi:hypothetical protein
MTSLIHYIYSSAASNKFREDDLPELLKKAQSANEGLGITGMLVYINGNFLQVIEGAEASVDELFAKISKDPRHKRIFVIVREPVTSRSFGDWSMGYEALLLADVETLIGENDFFDSGSCVDAMDAGIAKTILASFRQVQRSGPGFANSFSS